MPNWCENDLYVRVPYDCPEDEKEEAIRQLAEFKKKAKTNKKCLDEEKFIPYPKKFRKMDKEAKEGKRDKDGFNSGGYEWCSRHWGTKWGICDPTINDEYEDGVEYFFTTAWSPPEPIVIKMSKMFPLLNFELRFFEQGVGFNGILECQGGEVLQQDTGNYYGDRGG